MTSVYYRFFNEIHSRLDENYNNPRYDEIQVLLDKNKFKRTVSLNDKSIVTDKTSGKTPDGIRYLPEGVPFLGASNINNEEVDTQNCERIDVEMHESKTLSASKITKDTLLITIAGSIGRCAIYTSDEEANCNQAVAVLRLNKEKVHPYYIAEYLNSRIGELFFGKLQHISSQPNINLTELGEITLVLPTELPNKTLEQERILETLRPLKEKLQELKNIRETKMQEINSIFLQMLDITIQEPKTYFFKKGKESTDSYFIYIDSLEKFHYLFNAPKSQLIKQLSSKYATLPLKDLCIEPINRGEQPEYTDGEINVIKTIDMHNRHIDFENCLKVSQEFYDAHPTAQVKKGDVLIASTGYGSLGKVDIYDRKEPAFVDGHISIVRLKEDYDPYFIMYFLRSTLGQIQFEKWFSGSSGQIEIQPTELGKFLLLSVKSLPLTMQQKIASAISKIYNEIDQLDTKIIVTKKEIGRKFFDKLFI